MSLLRVIFSKVSLNHWRRLARVARSFAPKFKCEWEDKCAHDDRHGGFCVLKLIQLLNSDSWKVPYRIYQIIENKESRRMAWIYNDGTIKHRNMDNLDDIVSIYSSEIPSLVRSKLSSVFKKCLY